ncbi:hypothetical protein PPL_01765 [Heterostelium album PN500]|uniref:HIT-type domain-containing protein n=1 Tax=Heterostelium pallidum (strain ATCC 26659 / Pp 5 / PN500) TaxID=670386 RepID=D3B0E9_HETP5|nr:hypothetical protein PPL_01765 [Heterostelium album PN500]EFA84773.1 hypothetical protein PPL_01765 [Heterostelium album PN500]|eukprot:XP_020436885.1 hypothetical protein PPL_01765 [Heterostelium album PN500]
MKRYHHLEVGDKDILSNLYIVNQKHTGHDANKSSVKSITKNKKIEITVLEDDNDHHSTKTINNNNSSSDTSKEEEQQKDVTLNTTSSNNNNNNNKKFNSTDTICSICPRCFIGYCTSECFKRHNERCTGLFYEEQYRDNLKAMDKIDPKDSLALIKKMKEIYNREDSILDSLMNDKDEDRLDEYDDDDNNDVDEDDDGDNDDVDLSKLNLDEMSEEQLLSLLTKEEIDEFHQSMKDGTIGDRLEPWNPWWTDIIKDKQHNDVVINRVKPKIVDITDIGNVDQSTPTTTPLQPTTTTTNTLSPLIHPNIPALSTIFPNKPSDYLYNHIVDIIYCYCFLMRRFNGEWGYLSFKEDNCDKDKDRDTDIDSLSELCDECSVIIELSIILKRTEAKTVFTSLDQILETLLHSTHQLKSIGSGNDLYFSLFVLEDTSNVMSTKQSILASLSHMYRHFNWLNRSLANPKHKQQQADQLFKLTINFATQKLLFFMAWCNDQPESNFQSLSNKILDFFIKKRKLSKQNNK